jgi:hypothetical protein
MVIRAAIVDVGGALEHTRTATAVPRFCALACDRLGVAPGQAIGEIDAALRQADRDGPWSRG